jgi:hypothetical protein
MGAVKAKQVNNGKKAGAGQVIEANSNNCRPEMPAGGW